MGNLSLSLLGGFRVTLGRDSEINFSTDKTRALLAFLVVEGDRPHRRQALAGVFWPNYPERAARTSLRSALANLRRVIGDHGADPPFLIISRQTIQFNLDSDYWMDVSILEDLHNTNRESEPSFDEIEEVANLYQGVFLRGFSLPDSPAFDDWIMLKRERLDLLVRDVFDRLATGYEEAGDLHQALVFTRRRVELDPWQEPAQRELLRLLVATGQRAAALAQYETCKRLLAEELAVEPERETTHLYERIRDGKLQETKSFITTPLAIPDRSPSFLKEAEEIEVEKPVFVGREHELNVLHIHLEEALGKQGRVAFVVGGAGQGKTALMDEFTRQVQTDRTIIVTRGYCNAYSGVGDPYLPFRQVLEMLSGDVEDMWAAGQITKEQATLLWQTVTLTAQAIIDLGPDLIETFLAGAALFERAAVAVEGSAAWLSRLNQLVQIKITHPGSANLEQKALIDQYARVLERIARHSPLLIVLDDFQWADLGSIDLLLHLMRRLAKSRVLILCAYRPDEISLYKSGERHPLATVTNELQRLLGGIVVDLAHEDPDTSQQFVNELLDVEPNRFEVEFRQALHNQTRGHPLFTTEILRMLQERGDLIRDPTGYWVEKELLAWNDLPARVEAVIEKRVSRLDTNQRGLLAVASVEGEEFSVEVVAQVLNTPIRQVIHTLSEELSKGHRLLKERGEIKIGKKLLWRFRFSHHLFQRYVYNSMSKGERRLIHEEVARTLENLFADDIDPVTIQLAHHYSQTGVKDKALYYLTQAGHQARARYDGRQAVHYYTEALALLADNHTDRYHLLSARSAVYDWLADRVAQRADIEAMSALAELLKDQGFRCDALLALTDFFLATEPFLAREPAQQAREIAREMADGVREAQALRRLAWAGRLGADFETSLQYIEEATLQFTRAGMPGEAASCLLMLARRLPGTGEHVMELSAAERALTYSRESGDRRLEAVALKNLAIAYMNWERYSEALLLAEEALAMQRDLGDRSEECNSLDVLGVVLARLGRKEEAATELRRCLALADEIGSDWGVMGAAFGLRNYWYISDGEYEQLKIFIDERLRKAIATQRDWLIGFFSYCQLQTQVELGQLVDALTLTQSAAFREIQGDRLSQVLVLAEVGWIYGKVGQTDNAYRNLEAALKLAEDMGDPYLMSWPLLYLANIALAADKPETWRNGLRMAERAIAAAREVHEAQQLAEALDISARLHLALGELEKAFDQAAEAVRLLEINTALPRPQNYLSTHAQTLLLSGHETESNEYMKRAYDRVMLVAGKLTQPSLRRSWLKNVRENSEIVRRWKEISQNR